MIRIWQTVLLFGRKDLNWKALVDVVLFLWKTLRMWIYPDLSCIKRPKQQLNIHQLRLSSLYICRRGGKKEKKNLLVWTLLVLLRLTFLQSSWRRKSASLLDTKTRKPWRCRENWVTEGSIHSNYFSNNLGFSIPPRTYTNAISGYILNIVQVIN